MRMKSKVVLYIPGISEPIDTIETWECETCHLETAKNNQGLQFLYP